MATLALNESNMVSDITSIADRLMRELVGQQSGTSQDAGGSAGGTTLSTARLTPNSAIELSRQYASTLPNPKVEEYVPPAETARLQPNMNIPVQFVPDEVARRAKVRLRHSPRRWQSKEGGKIVDAMVSTVQSMSRGTIPPVEISRPGDGSILMEWQWNQRRVGISMERDRHASTWFFLDLNTEETIRGKGSLDSFDPVAITKLLLQDE